ncbi:MAG: hypothetical protein MJ175_00225 [Clostridia bacterium]|nr:hypothetical protein [Clostridia bacterium]
MDMELLRRIPWNKRKLRTFLLLIIADSAVLFCGAFGAAASFVTGFGLPVEMKRLAMGAILLSFWFAAIFHIGPRKAEAAGDNRKQRRRPMTASHVRPGRFYWLFYSASLLVFTLILYYHAEDIIAGFGFIAARTMEMLENYDFISYPDNLVSWRFRLAYSDDAAIPEQITKALGACMTVFQFLFSIVYLRRRSPLETALLPVPVFVLCFLIIGKTMPKMWAITIFLLFFGMLVIGGSEKTRKQDLYASSQRMLCSLVPMLILILTVYQLCPPESYVKGSFTEEFNEFGGDVLAAAENKAEELLMYLPTSDASFVDFSSGGWFTSTVEGNTIALDRLKRNGVKGIAVMRVKSDEPGVFYLRQMSYDTYTGTTWEDSYADAGEYDSMITDYAEYLRTGDRQGYVHPPRFSEGHITLSSVRSPYLFTPYYFENCSVQYDTDRSRGYKNSGSKKTYTFDFISSGEYVPSEIVLNYEPDAITLFSGFTQTEEYKKCLAVENRNALWKIVNSVLNSDGMGEVFIRDEGVRKLRILDSVTDYVKNHAAYSRTAPQMPEGETDLVKWFLEDADEGFCVHFASAEVMLLRAAGIPARLAVGYLVEIKPGQINKWQNVTDADGHAWAEIFDEVRGWVPIEATPASAGNTVSSPVPGSQGDPVPGNPAETHAPETAETVSVVGPDTAEVPGEETDSLGTKDPGNPPSGGKPSDEGGPTGGSSDGDPSGGNSDSGTPIGDPTGTPRKIGRAVGAFAVVLILGGAISVLPIRRRVLLERFARLCDGTELSAKDTAGAWFALCCRIERAANKNRKGNADGIRIPQELYTLAEKARFSSHTLSDDELSRFRIWYEEQKNELINSDTFFEKLRHRFIDVFY